ncbi:MAG: HD domain-containing protein, partial [Nitrosopumilus sp.]|nr:HD domain-containing protein [Nitrosopumilus sp.]
MVLQQFANTHSMRNEILNLMVQKGLEDDYYVEMLDYTIDLFESQGLGTEYYGYHNINHELEVTYVSLLATDQDKFQFTNEDIKYLYIAALFHDFDPQKNVDKPHEESV